MSLWNNIVGKYEEDGLVNLGKSSIPFLQSRAIQYAVDKPMGAMYGILGTNIYDEPWDLLVILDACRYDVMKSVLDDDQLRDNLEATYSNASSSKPWLERNFGPEHSGKMAKTAFVTGNPFTDDVFDGNEFRELDEVWRYAWEDERGIIPPRPITDRAISIARNDAPSRLIAHYMQPHFPALANPELGGQVDPNENRWINSVWDQLKDGSLSRDAVWSAYEQNLLDVFDEVTLLLNSIDAERVVITADHGNGFGEAGIYGHPANRAHPVLRKVPWIETTATDTGQYSPDEYERTERKTDTIEDRLAALGYRDS